MPRLLPFEESKDIDSIPLTELIGNLQTYELGLTRLGKGTKIKSTTLKAKSNETDKSSDDEDSNQTNFFSISQLYHSFKSSTKHKWGKLKYLLSSNFFIPFPFSIFSPFHLSDQMDP